MTTITEETLPRLRELSRDTRTNWALPIQATLSDAGLADLSTDDLLDLPWYGPLEQWLNQPQISDVLINGPDRPAITIEQGARLPSDTIIGAEWLVFVQQQLMVRSGLTIPEIPDDWPGDMVIGTVERRMRFAITRPPVSPAGPTLALRLLPRRWRTLDDLVKEATLPRDAAELLVEALRNGVTLLVAGGAGSGKTTLLAALLQAIGEERRVAVVEELSELPELPDSIAIEALRSGQSLGACVRFALRQRPDLIALGEVRGAEALALLQAAATGYPALATLHAPDAQSALRSLERMACEAADAPTGLVRGLISSAPLLVAHIGRYGGRRRVGRIEEALPQNGGGQGGERYPTQTLWCYDAHNDALRREGWVQGAWGRGRL